MEAYASTSVMFALTVEQQPEDKTSQGRRQVCLRPQYATMLGLQQIWRLPKIGIPPEWMLYFMENPSING